MPLDLGKFIGQWPTVPVNDENAHRVTMTIGSETIDGWTDYEILSSMIEPADGFSLSRPFDRDAWKLCVVDQRVKVAIDGTVIVDGYIDDRQTSAKNGDLQIAGRDKSARLVQESVPNINGWDGLRLDEAVRQLAAPWFTKVTLSDARNRFVRRGKGHRASANDDDAVFRVKGKLDEEHAGRLDPGETRWAVIEQLCSSVGILAWSSGDGVELVIGEPNYSQAIQYLLKHAADGSTVKDMVYKESVADRFAMIEVQGTGGSVADDDQFSYIGRALDGPNKDGTGRDFLFPKRLVQRQQSLDDNAEAQRAADRDMRRRNFQRRTLIAQCSHHGQLVAGTIRTLFAPNTLARVQWDDLDMDETWLPHTCRYRGARGAGETTELQLVPRGTEFVAA